MDNQISSNGRVARNAVMLSVRMLLIMVVGLYTSRVVLSTLGVKDYGIYGLVGGIVAMVSFLNASMSNATSRFLIFNLGKGDRQALDKTFATALFTHVAIAAICTVVIEIIGLWLLYNKLVIPEGRMDAAFWTFQASVICMAIVFIQTPFNAAIIAHERMGIYAYIEILNSVLKLAAVYVLMVVSADKLILYSFLVVGVHAIIFLVYYIYDRVHFEECRLRFSSDREYMVPMLSFSGWNVFRNLSVSARQWANNFLINIFFGVVLNAASTIATTIYGMIMGLANSVTSAFSPKIVKLYAQEKIDQMNRSIATSTMYAVLIMGCITVPAVLEMSYLIRLWLGRSDIDYATEFCCIQLLVGFMTLVTNVVVSGIMATGKVKGFSLVYGGLYLLSIPLSYIVLRCGVGPLSTYLVTLAMGIVILLATSLVLKRLVPGFSVGKILTAFLVNLLAVAVCGIPSVLIHMNMEESFLRVVLVSAANVITLTLATYFVLLDKDSRKSINNKVRQMLKLGK